MSKLVETKSSSFEVDVEKPIWVNVVVKEYDSIVKRNGWKVVPRLVEKSMVGSR